MREYFHYTYGAVGNRLTQVLSDGENAYLYGAGRIGEQMAGGWQYPLGDALGSVRQLNGLASMLTHTQIYKPLGEIMNSDNSTAGYALASLRVV